MTGNFNDSDGLSPSSRPVGMGRSTMATGKNTLHQRNTPRAQRFSQKLMKASKKSPLARYPLATPTTSISLSPSMELYMDDESMTDNHSCFSSSSSSSYCFSPQYQRDDSELNRHLQDLILSPLRSVDITSPIESPMTIGNQWRIQREKRPEIHQRGSDSPSLSAKPKRRKLKQQRTTAWRTGADITLDTKKVHQSDKTIEQPMDQSTTCRRSTRIAGKKQRIQTDITSNSNRQQVETTKKLKNHPVILGTSTGVKSSQATDSDPILLYDDDNENDNENENDNSQTSDGNKQHPRRRRPRIDIAEEQLDKLMTRNDSLDLDHLSLIPKNHKGAPAPIVIVLDKDEDDSCTIIKSEPNDNDYHHFTSPSHIKAMMQQLESPTDIQIIDGIDEDEDMPPIQLDDPLPTPTTVDSHPAPSTDSIQSSTLDQVDASTTSTNKQQVIDQSPLSLPEETSSTTTQHSQLTSSSLTSKNNLSSNKPLEILDSNQDDISLLEKEVPSPSSSSPSPSLSPSSSSVQQSNEPTSDPKDTYQPTKDNTMSSSNVPSADPHPEIPQGNRTDDTTEPLLDDIPTTQEGGNVSSKSNDSSLLSKLFGPVAHYLIGN